jgi:MFS family permease
VTVPDGADAVDREDAPTVNRISPTRFVVGFGIVSGCADIVYEGARSIIGPYLATLGATAATVGLVTGLGEATALVLRLVTGRFADRTGRPWPQTMAGYVLTAVCVPLLALTGNLATAAILYNGERLGKAVRTPARDIMLAHASAVLGRGKTFGLHKVLDTAGSMIGPLFIAGVLAVAGGSFRLAFALMGFPGLLAVVQLVRLRRRAPDPIAWEPRTEVAEARRLRLGGGLGPHFWAYSAFSVVTMLGFSTWAVLAVHITERHLLPAGWVPVLYAAAMAAAGGAALLLGRLYDTSGLRGLILVPLLSAIVPWLSFSGSVVALVVGAVVWGAVVGIQDSTMRAAVADLVPGNRRGAGYGTFAAVQGGAWLVGSTAVGWLYERSTTQVAVYVGLVQLLALACLVPLLRRDAAARRQNGAGSSPG